MSSWIVGVFAVCCWALGIWLWLSRSNDIHQQDGFEKVSRTLQKEFEALKTSGDQAALEEWLRKQTKRWTMNDWLHWSYAEALHRHGKTDAAVSVLNVFIRRVRRLIHAQEREASTARMVLVRILLDAKRTDEAEKVARTALSRPYAHASTAIMYANIARDRGDHAEAAVRFLAAIQRFPSEDAAAKGAVDALLAQGLAQEAEDMLQEQMKALPRAHALAILYARLAQERGDLEQAAERWAYVRDQFVFRKEAYTEGAEVLRKLGRDADAEAVLASRPRDISELAH
jgi:predicted Zn-dependent protease